MKEVIEFIQNNWQYISFALIVVAEVVLFILKRRPKVYGWYLDMLNLVIQAENTFVGSGRGDEKLEWVVNQFIHAHDLTNNSFNVSLAKSMVEKILSAPSKKGVTNEKTNEKIR